MIPSFVITLLYLLALRLEIVAQASITGSIKVRRQCWIGPNVSIRDRITKGDYSLVGVGAVVVKLVLANYTVAAI